MDIVLNAPLDLGELIMKHYFSAYVVPKVLEVDKTRWMWKCSLDRKRICTERGAIQLGHCEDYDGWARVYLEEEDAGCTICGYDRYLCEDCCTSTS